jgi:uncharacterized protein YcgI (DUF1989 family)
MATVIPAQQGAHAILHRGQRIQIINPSGHQVVDAWAFPDTSVPSWMSMAQTRSTLQRVIPVVGDTFVDTHRKPVLTMIEDTSPGVHDMIFPPCDDWRYTEAGADGHGSCAGNLRNELASIAKTLAQDGNQNSSLIELESKIRTWGWTPEPLNLFMNVPIGSMKDGEKGKLQVARPTCQPGAYVILRADVDCFVVMSACPNDLLDTNGGKPSDAAYEIMS